KLQFPIFRCSCSSRLSPVYLPISRSFLDEGDENMRLLTSWRQAGWGRNPLALTMVFMALVVGAFFLGRSSSLPEAAAAGPVKQGGGLGKDAAGPTSGPAGAPPYYSRPPLAFFNCNIKNTQEALGEIIAWPDGARSAWNCWSTAASSTSLAVSAESKSANPKSTPHWPMI